MGKPDDELRADIFGLVVGLRRGKHANESASDVTDRVLAAFAEWNRRTAPPAVPPNHPEIPDSSRAAVPGEPTRTLFQCPSWCLRGLPIHSEGCPNRPPADPTGAEPGTGKP